MAIFGVGMGCDIGQIVVHVPSALFCCRAPTVFFICVVGPRASHLHHPCRHNRKRCGIAELLLPEGGTKHWLLTPPARTCGAYQIV